MWGLATPRVGVLRRRDSLLLVVDEAIDLRPGGFRYAVFDRVKDGEVLFAGRVSDRLRGVPFVFAVGVAQLVDRVRELSDRVRVLGRGGGRV